MRILMFLKLRRVQNCFTLNTRVTSRLAIIIKVQVYFDKTNGRSAATTRVFS